MNKKEWWNGKGKEWWKDRDFVDRIEETFEKFCGGSLYHNAESCLAPEAQSGDSMLDVDEWRDRLYLPLLFSTTSKGWETKGVKGVACTKKINLDLNDFIDYNLIPFLKWHMHFWIKDLIKEAIKEVIKEGKKG